MENNFLQREDITETYGLPYDPYSIMHYKSTGMSKDKHKDENQRCKTITSRVN